ncbi:MAG: TonB-dependent receptor [Burkholderiales bacterium]|nr:TonB-dependent receptor [Burkholderiales bacterium]
MHSPCRRAALAASVCLLFSFAPVAPAEDDAVVVTATRTEQRVRDSIPHTTILTAREIRESGAVDLLSLLRREPGFEFTQNGGIGTASGTFIRGAAANQVLVLVDGVRISSLTTGATQLEQLMLDQVERVEIVRGNVSSLYGSGAIGGVIQVFTRTGRGAPRASAEIAAGGEDTARLRAGFAGEVGATRFSVNASAFRTGGFSAIRPELLPNANPDRDGYRNTSLSASLAHRFAPGHEAGLRLFSSDGRVEFDNDFGTPTERNRNSAELDSVLLYTHNQLASRWLSRLSLAQGRDRFDMFTDDNLVFRVRTRNAELRWQNDILLSPEHTLTVALEHLRQSVASTTAYARTGRDVDALAAGYVGRFGRHGLQLNLRSERYSDFGRANTHFAGYGFDLTEAWRLTASVSRAFRAPTFNELFFPGFGNPNLRPERSRSAELGLQYAAGPHLARAVAFRSKIADLVNPFPIVNMNEAEIAGLELSYRGVFRGVQVKVSLTFQDPVQRTAAGEAQLIRRAKNFGGLALGKSWGPWRVAAELVAAGRRLDNRIATFPPERVELRRYGVVNAVAEYRFSRETSAYARLDNAFDRDYSLVHGYNTQGRRLIAGLRHEF